MRTETTDILAHLADRQREKIKELIIQRDDLLTAAKDAYYFMNHEGVDFGMVEDATGIDVREIILALNGAIAKAERKVS